MSHINRTRPRQGLQLVIRRVAGSQISHIFRRASAGSEALPSLARRVSMQQHAELTCRGNTDRGDFWEGCEDFAKYAYRLLSISYLLIALVALVVFSGSPFKKIAELGACQRSIVIVFGIIVSAGPPLYFWFEARAFDWWLNQKFPGVREPTDVEKQKQFRETYKLNADNSKAFWAGILAVYAAVLFH